tara:strand:+ start:254 stop:478 length:225 start_codon:yes stop_codon:yes gene_type:complete
MKSVKLVIKERTDKGGVQGTLYIDAEGTGKYSDIGAVWMSSSESNIVVNMLQEGCSEDVHFILEDNTRVQDDEY